MATEVKITNYWISSSALYIQLNAMGEPNYIQCSVAGGASILCYMQDIEGLGYDAGHNYQRWPLVAYPSLFPDTKAKYVYIAIPRVSNGVNGTAMVVFPSERIDIYGKSIASPDKQVGNEDFYYVYLQGEISEVLTKIVGKDENGKDIIEVYREWTHNVEYGSLATDEALASGGEGQWWRYESVHDTIKFLKTISEAAFTKLTAATARISTLILNGHTLSGVAAENTDDTSAEKVVTPEFLGQFGVRHFLSKEHDDTANGIITFLKGIVFGAEELWRITKDGIATLFSLSVKGDTQLGDNGTSTTFGDYKNDTSGAVVRVDDKGVSYMEADYITIRRAADFREITIRELRYIGGELAITPASMQVSKVERLDASGIVIPQDDTSTEVAAYKCYFETEGTDGQKKLYQEFMPYDQARCQQWGIDAGTSEHVRTKYYWRLVTAVGTDYIILSNKTYDTSTENSEPAVGDNIVQLGYQGENRPNRQSAIILSATSTDAPSQKYYQGIHDFTLADCVVKDEGYDAAKGTFHTHTYGDSYVGDKDGNGYMKYDSKTKTVTIKGTVHFDSDSTKDGEEIASKADLRDLNIKSGNLLRNTSFCGDYEDIEVSDDLEMTDDSEVYSDKLKYWTLSKAKVVDDSDTTSGKAVSLSDGSITQQLTAPLLANSEYTLSFRGKGTTAYIEVCGVALTQTMDTESRRYELHFSTPAEVSSALFKIKGTSCTISEIMLSYGSLAPAWSPAYSDNDKSLAEFKNIKFLTDAITEGSTTIDGGLVMSQQFRVGNYRNKKMIKETGGMSGYYNDDNSPFLWGGGSLAQAIYTIQKYKNDPTYQPTEEEISNMAKFVVTHGGRAILNDIILRGIIYAEGGVMKSVKSPNGNFEIDEHGNVSLRGEINATKGSIGGFTINSSYIGANMRDSEGNVIENSVAKGISIFDDFICFNAKNRQAIMGTWYSDGVPLLQRLIDAEKDFYGRTASVIGVTGGFQYNTAISIIGGSINGLNFKNKTVGFNKYQYSESQQTFPDLYEVTLSRDVAFVFVSPRCKWQGKDSETFTDKQQNIVITLPDIHSYDDGHVIVFRRDNTQNPLPNVRKSVILKPARSCRLELKDDNPVYGDESFEDVWYDSFIYTKGGDAVLSYSLSIGETAEFRFFPSNSTTIDNKTYVGMWLEI